MMEPRLTARDPNVLRRQIRAMFEEAVTGLDEKLVAGMAALGQKMMDSIPEVQKGDPGPSALDVWHQAGHTGDAAAFLASLTGPRGRSAYEEWTAQGYNGDETAFLASLTGPAGASAYAQWLAAGNTGSAAAFLASLKGAAGANAYEVWKAAGNTGDLTAYLASLKGKDGVSPIRFAKAASTDPAGLVTFDMTAAGFKAPPVVEVVVEATGARDFNATVTSRTATSCVVRVRRSRTLPAVVGLLSTLAGYDPWEPPGVVTVHLIATEPT